MRQKNCLGLIFFFLFFFISCKSSNAPQEPPGPPQLPGLTLIQVNDPVNHPEQVSEYIISSLGYLRGVFLDFERAKGTPINGRYPEWTWTTQLGTWDLIIHATALSETQFSWKLVVDFNEEGRADWTRWMGTISAEGKDGAMNIYTFDSQEVNVDLAWDRDAQDVLHILSRTHELPSVERLPVITEITARPDGQVEMVVTTPDTRAKIFEASWDATGAGSWVSYNPATGQQTGSGTWN